MLALVRAGDAGTASSFRGTTRAYTATHWDSFWNGLPASGLWRLALINRGVHCSESPSSVTLNVRVRP